MYQRSLYIFLVVTLFYACGQESESLDEVTQSSIDQQASDDSSKLSLTVADSAGISQIYEFATYTTQEEKSKYSQLLLQENIIDSSLEDEMKEYNFKTLALAPGGKVYDLASKKPLTESCFPILFDHLSGLIFSHSGLDSQYEHFKSTEFSIETPFSGTWCVNKHGVLTKFVSNGQVSLSDQSISYFLNHYMQSLGYFEIKELAKHFIAIGLISYEEANNSPIKQLQLTKLKATPSLKVDHGADPVAEAIKRLNNAQKRREQLTPRGDQIYAIKPAAPVHDLESVEVVLGSGVHYDLRKQSEFHVVSNGNRSAVIQGGPTCNPSACVNALTYLEPNGLKAKAMKDLYEQLIDYDYSKVKANGIEVDQSLRETNITFTTGGDDGYKTQRIAGAFNAIAKNHKLLKKYRLEARMIKNYEKLSNLEIARILLKEFNKNNKMPMMIGTKVYKLGRLNGGSGHELTLENIEELNGNIWLTLFDSNGRSFTIKAGPEMRMDTLHQAHSSRGNIIMQSSPIREFDLWGDYILFRRNDTRTK